MIITMDLELDVTGQFVPGDPGSREEPPTPDGFEIDDVKIGEVSILNQLTKDQLAEIEKAGMEEA